MKKRALFSLLLTTFIGAGALWLGQKSEERPQEQQQRSSSGADYYMTRFTATEMDESGHPKHRIQAEYMAHSAEDDTIKLTQPQAILFRPGEADWQLQANHGVVEEKGELLRLKGDVLAQQPAYANQPMTEFRTDTLLLKPNDHYAETGDPVVLTHGKSRIDAVGMRAFLEEERVELLSAVRGYYEPQH